MTGPSPDRSYPLPRTASDPRLPADPDERAIARRLEHRIGEDEAAETAIDLVSGRPRKVFML
jgi:hypothetical protein